MSEETAFSTSDDEVETGPARRGAERHAASRGARRKGPRLRPQRARRKHPARLRRRLATIFLLAAPPGFRSPAPESTNRRAVSRRLRRRRARKGAYFRRDAGAAPLGDLLALSPARRTAGHERSAHLDRARRHQARPWPPARPERSDLRRRPAAPCWPRSTTI